MILFANAKINLGLHITRKRPDGFHDIETVLYPIPFFDVIEFYPASRFDLRIYGINIPGPIEENLVFKAFHLMRTKYSVPEIEIHLIKNIPTGSGLGGGSSDAAYMLSGLNRFFQLGLNNDKLKKLAGELGSDCPFFIENKPVIAFGKGDVFHEIDLCLKGYFLVLAFPDFSIKTKEAYSLFKEPFIQKTNLHNVINKPIEKWDTLLTNDFENVIFPGYPKLEVLKNELIKNGAIYASLTGSGSTVYGIYKNKPRFTTSKPNMKYQIFHL
ncbi:MAG: 4-(cytidine 5'-diphospho)-2-C-methyl-D-erythritol kinase [Bacteroidales bacterium]|nr:4-(cytidine 5'-diphospho)-2-C-methyl-D-erythritol kinase [Bacteroidales bacterium]